MSKHEHKQETAVAVQPDATAKALAMRNQIGAMAAEMANLGITAEDIVVPLLMLAQPTSASVSDGKAKMGDVFHSLDEQVLGGLDAPVEVVPLSLVKSIRVYDCSGSAPKWLRTDPALPSQEFEGTENGKPVKRFPTMDFYVLLKTAIDQDEAFPCIVRFKSTGTQAGRQLASHMFKMLALGRLPYSETVKLSVVKQRKETNTWATFTIGKGQKADSKALAEAEKWLPRLAALRVDEREEVQEDVGGGPTIVSSVVAPAAVSGPY